MVERVFEELQKHGLRNLLPVSNLLASLVLKNNTIDLEWLERKYREMTINFQDFPAYHWMTDDAHKEGIEEGIVKGIAQGREKGASRKVWRKVFSVPSSALLREIFPC